MMDACESTAICDVRAEGCSRRMDAILDRINSLAELQEKSIAHLTKVIDLMATAQRDALDAAKVEMDRRLENMNEFRSQLTHQASTFVDKSYYGIQHQNLIDRSDRERSRLDDLYLWRSAQQGRASWTNFVAAAALLVSIVFGILHFLTSIATPMR
jgi:hypothetical protein